MRLPSATLTAWGTIAAVLVTIASATGAGVVYVVRLRDDASASRTADADHESRLRVIESAVGAVREDVRETRTDVTWIRKFLDRDRQPKAKDEPQTASNEP